jgi:ABC-type sugar transport system permease subunit
VPGLLIGLIIALALRGVRRGGGALRASVFMPAVVTGAATALMWGWLLNPRFGLVNGVLGVFGIEGPPWLRDQTWAMPAMILIGLWNVGVNVVVYTAALDSVPAELREAAALDGAGPWARFRYIVWPALTPITFYLTVVNAITSFQVFTPTYLLTGGGPNDATLTTALYTYQVAFGSGQLGYASALTVAVFGVVVVVTIALFRYVGRRVQYLGAEG